jgi:transcription factor C subunit 7
MTWSVNPTTVTYFNHMPTPTSIPTDPALTSYGEQQAQQLGAHLPSLLPPLSQVYSSPYYRCLQTLQPGIAELKKHGYKNGVIVDNAFEEWYGETGDHREHPRPAPFASLRDKHFPHMDLREFDEGIIIKSSRFGESIASLHNRIAYGLHRVIERAEKRGEKSILICTHAAAMIAMGRVLTGHMPEDVDVDDFHCYTASLSQYNRKSNQMASPTEVGTWDPEREDAIPDLDWRGNGVQGGWDSILNGDCSFLKGGEERGWHFHGDESFLKSGPAADTFYEQTGTNDVGPARGGGDERSKDGDAVGKGSRL